MSPRGNDVESAVAEAAMRQQYGLHGNADDMIRSVRANQDPAVAKASLLGIDEPATAKLKEEGLASVAGRFDLEDGEELLDFNVRGNAIVGIIENEHGITRKAVAGANDDYKTPKLTPEQEALKAQSAHDRHIQAETARLRAEADERIRQAEEEENLRVAKELQKIREGADKELAKAQADADKAAAKDEDSK